MKLVMSMIALVLMPVAAQASDLNTAVQARLQGEQQSMNASFQSAANRVSAIVGTMPLSSQQSAVIQQVYASLGMSQQHVNNTFATVQQQVSTTLSPTPASVNFSVSSFSNPINVGSQLNNIVIPSSTILPTDTIQNTLMPVQY